MRCVNEALASFGKATQVGLLNYLQERRVWTSPENFSIRDVNKVLSELLGQGSTIIMEKIYYNFASQFSAEVNAQVSQSLIALEKIYALMEIARVNSNDKGTSANI